MAGPRCSSMQKGPYPHWTEALLMCRTHIELTPRAGWPPGDLLPRYIETVLHHGPVSIAEPIALVIHGPIAALSVTHPLSPPHATQ